MQPFSLGIGMHDDDIHTHTYNIRKPEYSIRVGPFRRADKS
jgi:hypothetical protein